MSVQVCPSTNKSTSACPFSASEHKNGSTAGRSECETFQAGKCPLSSRAKDDIEDMMIQIPKDMVTITNNEYEVKLNTINSLLPENRQSKLKQEILSDPELASAMREGTKIVHSAAENSVFTKRFLSGDISTDEYGRYINSLYFVYKTMERLLNKHKDDPVIQKVYFPNELSREKTLLKDLEYYYGKDRLSEVIDDSNITPAVVAYMKSLEDAASRNPALLIAHSYSRYLGDLSGGQILAKRLKKHVLKIDITDASWESYEGLEFYNFDHIGNHNEFKNHYRQCLDTASVTQNIKDLIVKEAIHSFELNIALFNEVQYLSESKKLKSTSYNQIENKVKLNFRNAINADWLVGFATGTVTLAFGLTLYHRYMERV
ncbi:hypothetical protein K501DRAFT_213212 [Backusella circina FSU 941]|nr:hypothetical protein K501DRAFT_213212 [Backusella circina FSU 941]